LVEAIKQLRAVAEEGRPVEVQLVRQRGIESLLDHAAGAAMMCTFFSPPLPAHRP
jgi:hypothetical protein